MKRTNNKINAITFVRERVGWCPREARDFVDSIAPDWHPAPEQAAGATAKQETFGETSPYKFSVRMVILVMVLVAGALVGWNLYSKHKAQMEAEEQHLYREQHQQGEQQRDHVKQERLRQREEACAERSAARRQNSAIEGKPSKSRDFFVYASTTGIQRDKRSRIRATVP